MTENEGDNDGATEGDTLAESGDESAGGTDSSVSNDNGSGTDSIGGSGDSDGSRDNSRGFPENWRDIVAGDDEKGRKNLDRFSGVDSLYKSYLESVKQNTKLSEKIKGLPPELPENATDAQLLEYRNALGIPEKANDYEITLGDDIIGEEDKELVSTWLEEAHQSNMPPDMVNKALAGYYKMQDDFTQALQEQDTQQKAEAVVRLEDAWGGKYEYQANMTNIKSQLGRFMSAEGVEDLLESRSGNGSLLSVNTDIVRGLSDMARELNPQGTVAPAGSESAKSDTTRLAEIENILVTDPDKYYGTPLEAEFSTLTERALKRG